MTAAESGQDRALRGIELGVGLLATLLLIAVHITVLLHAGALWRDEINTLNLAREPALSTVWALNEFDSFPILWFVVLRGWTALGFGETDIALRTLGMIVGLGVLGMLWLKARWLGYGVPLLSLLLFGSSPTTFRFGDSLRAYGCGVLLMLFTMGAIWRVVQEPTRRRIIVAGIAAILSVQCLYYNSVLLFAICMGGVAVSVRSRSWKKVWVLLGIGLASAVSLLPYLAAMRRLQSWNMLVKSPIDLEWIFGKFAQAVAAAGASLVWVWLVLLVCAVAVCIHRGLGRAPDSATKQRDLAVFLAVALVVGTVTYLVFLKVLSYPTQPWYYISVMAFFAVSIDAAIHLLVQSAKTLRLMRLGFFVAVALSISPNVWTAAHNRQTNVDAISAQLETLAAKDDLIIVNPWYVGVTFSRYYKGLTPWMTIPDLRDHHVHRYDLFKEKMMHTEPIKPLLDGIDQTLGGGHRVWLVGGLQFPRPGENPGYLPPAPGASSGWSEGPYALIWSRQVGFFVSRRARKYSVIPVPAAEPINPYENLALFMVER